MGPGPDARGGVAAAAKYDGGVRTSWIVSAATAFVLLGASILVFLNPVWVGFEQGRLGIGASTAASTGSFLPGCGNVDVAGLSGSIVHDLVLGGDFDVRFGDITCRPVDGPQPGSLVLTDAERQHMSDVRGVFQGFYLLVLLAAIGLVLTFRRIRDSETRAAWLRAVRRGAAGLAVVVAVLGAISVVAFDAAFEVFHRLFFVAGSYDFDPRTSRLIQLFPDQFWSETTLALGVVAIALSIGVAWIATRKIAAAADGEATPAPAALRVGKAARG